LFTAPVFGNTGPAREHPGFAPLYVIIITIFDTFILSLTPAASLAMALVVVLAMCRRVKPPAGSDA
jgi:hypothetical protein